MIHNTFLIRESTHEILTASQYWPIDIPKEQVVEFIDTRADIKSASGNDFTELPLLIGDHKMMSVECLKDVLLIFVTDAGEDERAIADKLKTAGKIIRKAIAQHGLEYLIEHYGALIESSIITKLKIALVGEGGTGKTTTLHLLLGDTPPLQYVPTIALNLETVENIRFGSYSLVLWDFAGQERFRKLWRFYFHGADVIFLVCDSTLRNVIISKDILKLIKRDAPKVPVFALANKQDKPNAMKPEVIQKILGIPTYPMVAIDKGRRDEMLRILMTAAAQYVGIALPDLPASELLRFTDTATEAAVATELLYSKDEEDDEEEEDVDYIEVVEEVYVDEDGHIIEDADEYEIVEEIVEEVVEEDEVVEPGVQEAIEEEPKEMTEEPPEMIEEEPVIDREEPVFEIEVTEEPEIVIEDADDEAVPIEIEEVSVEASEDVFEIVTTSDEDADMDVSLIRFEEGTVEEEVDDRSMAKDLISDALEADEIVSAEIEQIPEEELDTALEALSSDEVVAIDDEEERPADQIEESTKKEMAEILGTLDSYESEEVTFDDDEDDELSFGDYLAEELDDILGQLKKAGPAKMDEE